MPKQRSASRHTTPTVGSPIVDLPIVGSPLEAHNPIFFRFFSIIFRKAKKMSVCYVCYEEANEESGSLLTNICKCKTYIHKKCQQTMINSIKDDICRVCNSRFTNVAKLEKRTFVCTREGRICLMFLTITVLHPICLYIILSDILQHMQYHNYVHSVYWLGFILILCCFVANICGFAHFLCTKEDGLLKPLNKIVHLEVVDRV
jgi:hypothetical protein